MRAWFHVKDMLVSPANLPGIELCSYANNFKGAVP